MCRRAAIYKCYLESFFVKKKTELWPLQIIRAIMYGDNRSAPAADVDMVGGENNKKQFTRFFLLENL
jgi:hypothetical protein